MNRTFRAITLAAGAALVLALAIACGDDSDTDTDPGLSRADVEGIVRSEMASASETALTHEEVAEIAQAAVAMSDADSLTATDVEAIARESMSDMAAMTPGDGGLTRADVEAIVQAAVAEIPPPVPSAPGLSSADVERIVRAAIADIPQPPQPEPGLSAADVEKIARAAMPVMPPPLPPEPSLSRAEITHLAHVVSATPRSDPAKFTQFFVSGAIARYEAEGQEATLDYYNSPDSADGRWAILVIDEDNSIIASANPDELGNDISEYTDTNDYNFGADIVTADESGKWVSCVCGHPRTGEPESNHYWARRHDGLVFASRWFSGMPEYTQLKVNNALAMYEARGLEATLDYYNSAESVDGYWYVFVIDQEGELIGHYDPEVVGENLNGPIGTDVNGYDFGADMLTADEDGKWISYVFNNPAKEQIESKHSWVVRYDDLIFGSGWYTDPASYTKFIVDKAIALYESEGLEAAIEYYNDPENIDGQWYVGILDGDGVSLSHYDPAVRGQNVATGPIGTDVTGYDFGSELLTAGESGKWVSYVYGNPATGELGSKHSWLIRRDGLLFGSGWYTDPASYTKFFVDEAIGLYEAEGLEAALDHYNTEDSLDGRWYAFILDEDGVIIGHYDPEVVGQNITGPIGTDVTGHEFGSEFVSADESGKWVSYVFTDPVTGKPASKHSWLVRRDGLLFGSGWYTDPASYTQHVVNEAIERYESEGLDATVAYYSDPDNVDGQWYGVIMDSDGTLLAHYNEKIVGQSGLGPAGTDVTGYDFAADMLKATKEGLWVEFVFRHPVTGKQEGKRSWVVRHDGLFFTSGWYTAAPDGDADPGAFAKWFVNQALGYYAENGREVTLAYYNMAESMDGDWYVFVLEDRDGALYTIAHASRPELVGTTRDRIDASGFNYGEAFAAVTESGGGEWISYLFTHPTTREDAPKHTWVERRGDLLFGAGWYEK